MTKKKGRFLTFIFSLLPGAGEMYMGFMKMGFSLMTVFFAMIALGGFFGSSILAVAAVVVWFYAFFHANNLRSMDDEEFYALEDNYLFFFDQIVEEVNGRTFISRYRKVLAVVLVFFGISILWNNLLDFLYWLLPEGMMEVVYQISYRIPQIVLGLGIIAAGVLLIRGKKQEMIEEMEGEDENGSEEND